MDNDYKPHLLTWTDEKVSRFWNFRNNYKPYDDTWFTKQNGLNILKFVDKFYPLKGKVLDYGTGKGFLLQYLLDMYPGVDLYACDFTDTLVSQTAEKFKNQKSFKGCELLSSLPSGYNNDFFDVVFLIETIEHLTDNYLHSTLREIYRVLKPGGLIVITTLNSEVLEKTFVHCADCGATFHHMQHIRSWNDKKLSDLTKQFNFNTIHNKAIDIRRYGKNGFLHYIVGKAKSFFVKPYKVNLVYLGKKS